MLNAIGSLVLAFVIFSQWAKETRADAEAGKLRVEIAMAKEFAASENKRALDLERDIGVLRESLEATRQADAAKVFKSGLRQSLEDARQQNESWKKSLAERDARIAQLEADLAATRRRLDEAIVRLRQAGGR
jgi:small-conductance mechanosensitive channel